jgi:hypothetical protein
MVYVLSLEESGNQGALDYTLHQRATTHGHHDLAETSVQTERDHLRALLLREEQLPTWCKSGSSFRSKSRLEIIPGNHWDFCPLSECAPDCVFCCNVHGS